MTIRLQRTIVSATIAGALLCLVASPASAWVSYQLGDKYYAIRCADGTLHSYSGGADGLALVGSALCDGHGGLVVDPNAAGPTVEPAPKDMIAVFPLTPPPAGRSINEPGISVKSSVKHK